MAKKPSKEAVVEEVEGLEEKAPKSEAEQMVDETFVSVEMTPEQRDEFVRFMAEKKGEIKEAEEPVYVMDLSYEHNINGNKFGPGLAHIPFSMVATIQRGELRSMRREISLHTSSKRLYKVLQSGQAVPVRVK